MPRYLLDTNIVITVIMRRPLEVTAVFNENAGRMAISAIAPSELLHGAEKSAKVAQNLAVVEESASLSSINPGRETDRIEVFHRTRRLADEGRTWFETLAEAAVQYLTLTREITAPVGRLPRTGSGDAARAAQVAASSAPGLPPEVMAQAIEQVLHRHDANWSDGAVPALGGLTPRQAITSPAELERVKGLLREYEDGEGQQSAAQGRSTVSYQFLWNALGISR